MAKSSFKQERDLEKRSAEAARIREKYPDWIPPTPHQQLRTRLSASKLTDAGEDGSNNDLDQLDDQSQTPAEDGENNY